MNDLEKAVFASVLACSLQAGSSMEAATSTAGWQVLEFRKWVKDGPRDASTARLFPRVVR